MDRFEDLYELSPMQQGMLFHSLYAPGSGMYCEQLACTLAGDLDAAAFERSWQQVVDRHPVLRTGFHWQELAKPLQVVHGRVEVPWLREDWRELPAAAQEARLQEVLAADRRQGFALDRPPLLRLALFRTGEESHRFVVSFHHILMDGWCLPLVFREILMSYEASRRGEEPRIARPRPYRDFIAWLQRRPTEGEEAFWRRLLAGFQAPTPLPGEATPTPPHAAGEAEGYAERREALGHHESSVLHLLARSHQLTINTVVQAAWGLLLSRSSGEHDVVFGATTSGRPAELRGVEAMIGVFINTLPVRVSSPAGAPILPWLRELQDRQAEVREHEHTPLARIQAWSEVPQGQPLFESILVFENQPVDALATQERSFQIRDVQVVERTNYPLTLVVLPGPPLRLRAVYDRRRLSADGVARLLGHLRTLLTALAGGDLERQLGDLPLLTEAERHQLVHEWAAAEPAGGGACLHRLFAAHAVRAPEATAVTHGGDSLTYRELNRRANRLAHHLRALGVGPDVLVGLCLERSHDLVTAILATLKAGGAYVPIDPVYPAERIGYLLADSRAAVLVTDGALAGRLPAHGTRVDIGAVLAAPGEEDDPAVEVSPDALAYVIYTSGSTGRPKGVMVTHRNVVRLFTATERWFGFGPEDVWTLFHSYAFDFSVWEIWGALLYGGRVVVVPHWTSRSPDAFLDLLGREGVTVLNQTPSAFRQLLRAEEIVGGPRPPLRWVVFGGEALDLPGLAPWFARHGDERPRLVNMYGITETTVHVTWRPLSAADLRGGSVIGVAIPDLRLRVLDARGEPAPIGVAGEIHVGGTGLARGYLGRPELTAERFLPDPFAGPGEPGARLYRTGDLARLRPDGDLEYLGRIDHQVKIRGFRIELGEIETALAEHPAVREAVVAVRGDRDGGDERRLVAWVVAGDEAPGAEALRAFLKTRLPDHMLPAAFVTLDVLPLTPHGKVDRRALPEPGQERPDLGLAYVAPRTPFEEVLAAVWAQALGLDRVGVDDDFFALGGDSIRSVRVLALAREKGLDLSLEQVFGHPNVRALAAVLEGRAEAATEGPGRTGADRPAAPFSLIAGEDRRRLPDDVEDAYPLTLLQGGMLFHNELAPESGFYQNVTAFRLRGPLVPDALRAAIRRMAVRHPVLRTSFELHAYGEPLQLVHRTADIPVTFTDLRHLDPDAREAALADRFDGERTRPFERTRAPLLRFHVDLVSDDELELTLAEHHAILDGWSVAVLLSEIFRQYLFLLGRTETLLPAAPVNGFRIYVALEREALASEETRRWWAQTLDGADPCALPRWPDAGRVAGEGRVRRLSVPLPFAVGEGLEAFARRTGVPVKSALLAAHLRVLSLLTGRSDVVSGLVSDGRPEETDAERTLGLFVNTLPFRLALSPGSWSDLARSVFAAERAMLPHRRFPLAELQRAHGGAPLYEAVFNYVHFHVFQGISGLSDFELRGLRAFQVTELVFVVELSRDAATSRLRLSLEYGSGLLDPAQIELFGGYYTRALGTMSADPEAPYDATLLLAEAERHQILTEWNDCAVSLPVLSFVEIFRARAEQSPGATAVVFGDRSLTYGELARRSDRVAHGLIAAGAAPDTLIALLAERSADFLAAMIGAFQAGAAYLPLDPRHPLDRLSRLLADGGAPLAVADRLRVPMLAQAVNALPAERRPRLLVLEDLVDGEIPARLPLPPADGSRLAYAIYTSGSTGRPKGALVEQRGMVNHLWAKVLALGLAADDAIAQTAPQGFDISVWQFLAALLAGGRVHVLPDEVAHDPLRLIAEVERSGLTVLETVPSLLRLLLEEVERQPAGSPALAGLRWMIPTGEALPADLCSRWLRLCPGTPLLNAYGPTECSDDVTHQAIRDAPTSDRAAMPIGRPVANLRLWVLDASLGLLPTGVPGELYVAGAGVGRGYLGDGGRTAEVFVPDPFSGESGDSGGRLYRTGDLARLAPDGTIEFLGRLDHQVKIRGHRIELGEIEAALAAHPSIRAAVATVREDAPGEPRLVAYVVPSRLEAPEETDAARIGQWQTVFDEVYREGESSARDAAVNLRVWVSSYTGASFPEDEIRECVEDSVQRILDLRPRRLLEIGCGTGLLLERIAPSCDLYCGTDISAEVLQSLAQRLADRRDLPPVELLQRTADDLHGLPEQGFDVVVLNEVAQYFPSAGYLARVLEDAAAALAPGGAVFVGGLRSLPLFEAFHTSVALHQASAGTSLDELRREVRRRMAREKELLVDPELFPALAARVPRLGSVAIQLKGGRHHNELVKFRYDAVLRLDEAPEAGEHEEPAAAGSLADLRRSLEAGPESLVVLGLPNARLLADLRAVELLREDRFTAAGGLREALGASAEAGIDPADLWDLGRELGYRVEVGWSREAGPGRIDARFSRPGARLADLPVLRTAPAAWDRFGNSPARGDDASAAALAAELRDFLAGRLPEAMVPAAFVVLDELPLTSNGKLDRRALPPPEAAEPTREGPFAPPRTPAEEILAAIFADVLGREALGIHDDFFELGGHSLLATRVISWARNTFQVELPLRALFEHPTVAALAPVLEGALRSGGAAAPPIRPAPRRPGDDLPLSFAQQRLWFLDQLVPGNPFYNVPANVRVGGDLRIPALAASIAEVVRRHEALRTTFPAHEGRPVQRIATELPVPLPVVDLRALPVDQAEREADRLSREEVRRPFDLARGPLLRASLVRITEDQSSFLATLHHIVADGWSSGVLQRELAALYQAFAAGRPSPLSELPIQYADFAVWQRDWLHGEVLEQQLAYWRGRLTDPPALDLPTDRPRPAIGSFRGNDRWRRLPRRLADGLRALGRRRGATLYMTLLAVWNTLLHRYSGQTDLLVGTPIANRNRSEIEGLIGFFVNTLALRTDLSGAPSFLGLVDRAREVTLGAYAYQDLPFEKLVEEVHPDRDTSRNPLFQVVFVLQNFPVPAVALPGLSMRSFEVGHGTAKFDLTLFLAEGELGLRAALEYSTDLFDAPTTDRMLGHFETLAAAALAHPEETIGELPLLSEAERHQLLREQSSVPGACEPVQPGATLHGLFAAQAARRPGATAVTFEGKTISYGELDRRANRLARRLVALGVGPEARVALCLERTPALVTAVLASVKAGGAYVPLDPAHPRERRDWILADSGAVAVVTEGPLAAGWDLGLPTLLVEDDGTGDETAPAVPVSPEGLAYVIYTSGSTGRPKGVLVTHANAVRLFTATDPWFGFGAGDVWTLFHSYAFDFSVWEMWGALLYGGRLVVVPYWVSRSPEAFHDLLRREGVTVLNQTPSAFRQLVHADLEAGSPELALRCVVFGGEALDLRALAPWIERRSDRPRLINMYGITETTVHVTWRPVSATDLEAPGASPIGVAIPDLRVHLLDASLRPVPLGVPGELHVGGAGLARGYLERPELTAERFVPDPFAEAPGERLYRSGDLARRRPDGDLEYLGRIDQQVKVRGFRIELGEIEAALASHPAVREAVAMLHRSSGEDDADDGGARLVAYVVQERPTETAGGDGAERTEQVEHWRSVFDSTYGQSEAEADPTFDIGGWDSSYNGLPVPAEEMREWVEGTVARILAERPRRVLEIGCGTGLLLFRIAPHTEAYRGTDFSPVALERLRRRLEGRNLSHVELEQRTADDFRGIPPGSFDAIVLNSVAQYFPGVDYLVSVLAGAVRALAPGGVLFLGDLRSLPLLETFHASVELFRAGGSLPVSQLRERVRRSLAREEELVLDPALFHELARHHPEIGQVEIQLRRGRGQNELTRFRYDAVLRTRPEGGTPAADRLHWRRDGLSIAALRERLAGSPAALELTAVPNARLAEDAAAMALLDAGSAPATVDDLRRRARELAAGAVDPEELWGLGGELGYDVAITWSAEGPGLLDARLLRRGEAVNGLCASFPTVSTRTVVGEPWKRYANDPLAGRFARRLVPLLREHLELRLPGHMVPATFVLLDALPLTPNGKLDRRALPAPDLARPDQARGFVAPRGPVEEKLAAIWAEVLGVERVGAQDEFFELGGHSLLATQVVSRVRNAFAIELPLRALFEEPTLARLAVRIERERQTGAGGEAPPLVPRPRPEDGREEIPLSFAQQSLWLLDEMDPGRPDYNIPLAARLTGELDVPALAASLREILRRHESLRTTFAVADGRPVQRIGPVPPGGLPVVDLTDLPEDDRRAELRRLSGAEARRPFDLRRGPLARAVLLQMAPAEHVALLTLHHIAADGWSVGVLLREVNALYGAAHTGSRPSLPELPIQYADFALWQRRWLDGEPIEAQLAWWRRQLAHLPVLRLPTDRPRPAVRSGRGGYRTFSLELPVCQALRSLAEKEGATPFIALLAAFAALLQQASGQREVVIGTDVANRTRSELEGLIGFFVNQLVLRVDLAGDPTFRELLARAREVALAAYTHQDVPFERLVTEMQGERDLSRTPLFQVKLVLQNTPLSAPPLPGLQLALLPADTQTAKFDLLLNLVDADPLLLGEMEYDAELFEPATVDRLLARLHRLIREVVARPDTRLSDVAAALDQREAAEREQRFQESSRQRLQRVERRAVRGAAGD